MSRTELAFWVSLMSGIFIFSFITIVGFNYSLGLGAVGGAITALLGSSISIFLGRVIFCTIDNRVK